MRSHCGGLDNEVEFGYDPESAQVPVKPTGLGERSVLMLIVLLGDCLGFMPSLMV